MRTLLSEVLLSCLVVVSTTLALPQQASTGQPSESKAQEDAGKNTPAVSPPDPCDLTKPLTLTYPGVGASYIAGTIPGLYIGSPPLFILLDPYGGHQLKRKGRLALTPKCILFVFRKNKHDNIAKDELPKNLSVFSCSEELDLSGKHHATSAPDCAKLGSEEARRNDRAWLIAVPYDPVLVLSRARYATSDLLSISTGYAVAGAGLLAALSQGIKNAHTLELSLGGSTAGLLLYYYFGVLRPRVTENYLGIFIKNAETVENDFEDSEEKNIDEAKVDFSADLDKKERDKTVHGTVTIKKPSDELYKKSDVILFRVTNYHDYYNISAILSAKTGLTFVSETAEKPTK
jgi:hypothetical protein